MHGSTVPQSTVLEELWIHLAADGLLAAWSALGLALVVSPVLFGPLGVITGFAAWKGARGGRLWG